MRTCLKIKWRWLGTELCDIVPVGSSPSTVYSPPRLLSRSFFFTKICIYIRSLIAWYRFSESDRWRLCYDQIFFKLIWKINSNIITLHCLCAFVYRSNLPLVLREWLTVFNVVVTLTLLGCAHIEASYPDHLV